MGVDPEDDWLDDAVWRKANPSLDITVPIDKVRAAAHSARINTAEENSFRQLRLNQWVKQSIRWMPMHLWDKGNTPIDLASLEGRVCYAGLDLASTTDITALVLVFPPRNEAEPYVVVPYFWILEDNIELRVNRDQVPYGQWEREGLLNTIEGNVVHYAAIGAFIEELGTRFDIREIAYEQWGAVQMSQNLDALGFTVVPFGQGFKDMSPPSKELMKLALEGKIQHGGNKVLAWMVDNIHIRQDPAGNIKPDKQKSTEKSTGSWPPSWPWTGPSDAPATTPPPPSTTNEDYWFYDPENATSRCTSLETARHANGHRQYPKPNFSSHLLMRRPLASPQNSPRFHQPYAG